MLLLISGGFPALATAPNQSNFDGRIIEYDTTDLRGVFTGIPAWPAAAMSNLFVTWDETNLYIALQCRMDNTKVAVMMDIDPGRGTGATTTTNWSAADNVLFYYNDAGWRASSGPGAKPFGLDFMIATEGFYNSVALILYDGVQIPNTNNGRRMFDLPDLGNGNTPLGTAVDMVVLKDNTANPLKGFESRIPWNILYGGNTNRFGVLQPGHVVPTGATVRLFANIHNNTPNSAFSAPDTIPPQTSPLASYNAATGLLVTDDYIDVVIDQDADGFPDLAPGDVNAPYLTRLVGIAGSTAITGYFNEAVSASTVAQPANWSFSGFTVVGVDLIAPNRAVVTLNGPLPTAGTFIPVQTQNIEDYNGNHRIAQNALFTRGGPYLSSYVGMAVAGDFQGWNPSATNMTLIGDYAWMYDVPILSSNGIQFKFAANGTWATNFGRVGEFSSILPLIDLAGNPGGDNILISNSLSGTYRFLFNEQTRIFKLVQSGADTDGDQLPDEWEILHGLSPTDNEDVNGATGDIDGDAVGNHGEYISDTDPSDEFSYLVAKSITRADNTEITFLTTTTRRYRVESGNLVGEPVWTSLSTTNIAGTGALMTLTDTNNAEQRLYRINVSLP